MNKYADIYFKHLKAANLDGINSLNPFPAVASAITAPARDARKAFNDFIDQVKTAPKKYPQTLKPEAPTIIPKPIVSVPTEQPEIDTQGLLSNLAQPGMINFQ